MSFDDPVEGPVEAGDLLDDPRTDVEALCLCSLLWSSSPVARTITDTLIPSDFERPVYRDLFELVAAQIEVGTLHDPASVAAALTQTGRAAGHRGTRLSRALSDATMAGGAPEAVGHYAITVVCAAYRRGFHAAATSLTEAAIAGRIRRLLALADNHGNMSSWSLPCSRDVASRVSAPSSALRRRSCDLHVRHLYLPTPLHAAKPPLPEWVV